MTVISNVDESKRQILEQKKTVLMEKLNDIQFKLWDKSTPEVIEHISQLALEKVKLQSLLSKAQTQLEQLEPEIQNCNNDAEETLLEAISKQNWYGFKNKREIVFDSRTGILFPNFVFIEPILNKNWRVEKLNFSPNGIAKGKWDLLCNLFYYKEEEEEFINRCIVDTYNHTDQIKELCFPQKFKNKKMNTVIVSRSIFPRIKQETFYAFEDFYNDSNLKLSISEYDAKNMYALPAYQILKNEDISPCNIRNTPLEKAKIILDFFIEQDLIPNFDQKSSVDYNQIFENYYQRIKIQKQLVELDEEISELPEPVQSNVFTSDFDYLLELKKYDITSSDSSVWQYSLSSQKWISSLLSYIDEWENQNLDLVKTTVELKQELGQELAISDSLTIEEKQLLTSQLEQLRKRLDVGLTPLRLKLINLLSDTKKITYNLEQTDALINLANIENQLRPSFTLLAEHSSKLCTNTLKSMEWLDTSLEFVKMTVATLRQSADNFLILIDKSKQDFMRTSLESDIDQQEITKWFNEWRTERLSILKQIHILLNAGLDKIIDEHIVKNALECIQQYQTELDQFYLQKRLGIYTTYAFESNGHRQDMLETEQKLTELINRFMKQLEKVIFNGNSMEQKMWLIKFTEVWQQSLANQITKFLSQEDLIKRDDVIQIMSNDLRKIQQQNLITCLQDAQTYSAALDQREKSVNTLIFKMRKTLKV